MNIAEKVFTLRDGRQVVLRSPVPADAQAMIDYLRLVNDETHFLTRYPEEVTITTEREADILQKLLENPYGFQLVAFDGARMVSMCGVSAVGSTLKTRHRSTLGITVRKEFWSCGLGSLMMGQCIDVVRKIGFEQIELGVYSDNERALHLYEKLGFQRTGSLPRAYKLKDGSYRDEILMTLFL